MEADEPCDPGALVGRVKALGARWGEGIIVNARADRAWPAHLIIKLRGRVVHEADVMVPAWAPTPPPATETWRLPATPIASCSATPGDPPGPAAPSELRRLATRGHADANERHGESFPSDTMTFLARWSFRVDPTLGFPEGRDGSGNVITAAPLPYGAPFEVDLVPTDPNARAHVQISIEQFAWAPNTTNTQYRTFLEKQAGGGR